MGNHDRLIDKLYTAIHLNNINEVRRISNYLSRKFHWSPDYEMLSIAFLQKHINIVRFFLDVNCEIIGDNGKNHRGNSALHSAILHGDSSLVNKLLDKGAPLNVRNTDGLLPIHLLVYRNSHISKSPSPKKFEKETSEILNTLLRYDVFIDEVVNSYEKYGYTALHLAAECANENIIPILLEAHANFSATTEIGQTPLHIAVINGNYNIVDFLLKQGVSAFTKDHRGKTPLSWAIELQQKNIIEILINHQPDSLNKIKYIPSLKDDNSCILTAVKMNNPILVEYLLSKGANVNASWKNGMTPLHIAIEIGSEDILRILMDYGSNATAIALNGKTPLYLAVEREMINIVKFLLKIPEIKSSIYLPCVDGSTPLHLAVKNGNEEITKLLLKKGKLFINSECKESPLHIAVKENKKEILKILLDNPIICDTLNSFGKTALHVAAEKGSLEMVQVFCDIYSKGDVTWKEGYAALYIAALNGRIKIVKLLIDSGADLNAKTENYLTPLIAATQKGHLKIAKLLVEKNIDIDEMSQNGKSALHFAVENQFYDIVEFLLNNGANVNHKALGLTPLHLAAFAGNLDIVKILLQKGALVNAKNFSDTTPLSIAVQKNHYEIVKYLVENGADVYVQDHDINLKSFNYRSDCVYDLNAIGGVRPLLIAVDNGNQEIVEFLLQNECYPDVVGEKISPLHLASSNGNLTIVKILIEYGADLHWICEEKYTPLSHAIANGKTETFMHLMSMGINFQDNENNSSLHLSLSGGSKDKCVVEFLLDFGADVNARNRDDKIPLHCAISSENGNEDEELFQLLLDYGSNANATDKFGNTALHLAAHKGDFIAAKVFLDYEININLLNKNGETPLKIMEKFIIDDLILYAYKFDNEISPPIRMAKLFVTLIAFYQSIDKFVNNENLLMIKNENIVPFYEKCKIELSAMKMKKISQQISYYDILTEKESKLFIYLREEEIVQNLELKNLKKIFPCYATMIVNHVRLVKEKRELIVACDEYLEKLLKFKLPILITREIFQYLSISDMRNMYRALYRRRELIIKEFNQS